MEVSQEVSDFLEDLARKETTTKSEIVRRAFSVMKAFRQQKRIGQGHIGFTSDPGRLDTELTGILS